MRSTVESTLTKICFSGHTAPTDDCSTVFSLFTWHTSLPRWQGGIASEGARTVSSWGCTSCREENFHADRGSSWLQGSEHRTFLFRLLVFIISYQAAGSLLLPAKRGMKKSQPFCRPQHWCINKLSVTGSNADFQSLLEFKKTEKWAHNVICLLQLKS